MDVIVTSWTNEVFAFTGKHFVFLRRIPDRGSTVSTLTLIPKPDRQVEIYQAATSPLSIDYVARKGFNGVFTGNPWTARDRLVRFGDVAPRRAGICAR